MNPNLQCGISRDTHGTLTSWCKAGQRPMSVSDSSLVQEMTTVNLSLEIISADIEPSVCSHHMGVGSSYRGLMWGRVGGQ